MNKTELEEEKADKQPNIFESTKYPPVIQAAFKDVDNFSEEILHLLMNEMTRELDLLVNRNIQRNGKEFVRHYC